MFLDVAHRVSLVSEARTSAAPPLTVPAPAAAPGGGGEDGEGTC